MIYIDDNHIKVGGVILPGLVKNLEIKASALVEEQTIEGSSSKPKQATGYEDCKVTIELSLEDSEKLSKTEKLQQIQNLFKKKNQSVPQIFKISNEHTSIRGIDSVIFKQMDTKEGSKASEIIANLEFWEYVPVTITTVKKTEIASYTPTTAETLTDQYSSYLSDRGAAPKLNYKTNQSPAADDYDTSVAMGKVKLLPF